MSKFLYVFFLIVMGCISKDVHFLSIGEKELIKKNIEQQIDDYFRASRENNSAAMLDFWADSEEFVFAADGHLLKGYEIFEQQMSQASLSIDSVHSLHRENMNIFVLSPDAATCTLEFDGQIRLTSGDTIRSRGSWTYVFTRIDHSWKVIHSAGTHIYY